ncbi:hypothetical protein JHN52_28315 [Streptomyces sp. MBT97]|uniref:hypothetical protein n=1 Tax=Streptomyces sp. MBT97 TaxID=2800411 RepID=UPI00190CF69F|nr:hypothetical protein [Streptomyces sp. MBT97]MBK3636739.1 hypothetical protein [Streptomyces sp. MBT97]
MILADKCDDVVGLAHTYCERGQKAPSTAPTTPDTLDPLSNMAHSVAEAAAWTAGQLGKLIGQDGQGSVVDFTNRGFLQQYAVVFAASTVLVLVLWLLATMKRAMRGVPMTTAIGEAVGLLWLAVGACAFTPLVLYVVVAATDAVTDVLVSAMGGPEGVFKELGDALTGGHLGGGPIVLIIASVVTIALCGALALVIVMRALALYVGALLGVVIYSGLVDRNLWGHVRRWAGVMVALILVKPITVIILGLAAALESDGDNGPVATGIAVSVIALGVAIYIIAKTPGLGDTIRAGRTAARTVSGAVGMVAGGASATANVRSGIQTHGSRQGNSGNSGNSGISSPRRSGSSDGVSGGMGVHSNRPPKGGEKKKD